ncbi:MAG TPA: hypothetical protein VK727_02180 [Steroidobacteraceae bacterium]|nr:hypothetical protein [Steroidobacteraceae bacterium]
MTRWMRIVGGAFYGTQVLTATLVLIFGGWAAAAEIYATIVWARGSSGFAGIALAGLNVVCSWLLVFHLAGFMRDLRELRVPQHGQLLVGALIGMFALLFVAPCVLVWSLHGGTRDIVMVAMGSVAGTAGALLWQRRARARKVPGARVSAAAPAFVHVQRPNPWRAVRIALGSPYAPASWQRRVLELASLCAAIAVLPILVLLYRSSMNPRGFTIVFYVAQVVGFVPGIALCWLWPLRRLIGIFNARGGALTELALLPGLGGGRQQLRRLLLVALSLPALGLAALLIIALRLIALEHPPNIGYTKVAVTFLLIALVTVPAVLGQIAKPRATVAWFAVMIGQIWWCTYLTWLIPWDMAHRLPVLWLWLTVALVLAVLMVPIGMSIHSLRKILQRPHPFVETSA